MRTEQIININDLATMLIDSQIIDVGIDSDDFSLKLDFSLDGNEEILLEFRDTLITNYSRILEYADSCFYVNKCSIKVLKNNDNDIIETLGYGFKNSANESSQTLYPNNTKYHFSIEGDVCIDIICCKIQVFKMLNLSK